MSSKSKHRPTNKPPEGKLEKLPQLPQRAQVTVDFSRRELEWLDQVLAGVQVSGEGVVLCYRLRQKVGALHRQVVAAGAAPAQEPAAQPSEPAPAPAPAQEPPAAATA